MGVASAFVVLPGFVLLTRPCRENERTYVKENPQRLLHLLGLQFDQALQKTGLA